MFHSRWNSYQHLRDVLTRPATCSAAPRASATGEVGERPRCGYQGPLLPDPLQPTITAIMHPNVKSDDPPDEPALEAAPTAPATPASSTDECSPAASPSKVASASPSPPIPRAPASPRALR